MPFTAFYFMISQGPRSMVRAFLNDIPFYRFYAPDPVNRTGPAIHLLKPGENTFEIEIDRAPPESQVFFELNINHDHNHPVLYFEWPRDARHLPRDRRTPFRWEARFTPEGDLFSPAWLGSAPAEIPCAGTPELREAVRRFHAALVARDTEAYCAEMAFKAREIERAYPGWQDATVEDMRASVSGFFRMSPAVRPLDLNDVHFEARAESKLAHARRTDGGHVIEAITEERTTDDEQGRINIDPTFVRHGETWRLIY